MALKYYEKPVSKWNVRNLTDYMADEHRKRFNCDYAPFGSWQQERGLISQIFGTASKDGKYDKELVKEFIDECFASYRPTAQYPGTNFGFLWTYRQTEFARLKKDYDERKFTEKEAAKPIDDDITDWFKS